MLQRLALSDLDELEKQCGLWSRVELERMNQDFVVACERAFELGLESRASASAIVKLNGKQHADVLIDAAWRYLRTNMDEGRDVSFAEILARCPGVDRVRICEAFKQRLKQAVDDRLWA